MSKMAVDSLAELIRVAILAGAIGENPVVSVIFAIASR
jgi:hypothetical protein